jgi:DNA-binding SARP family transcriptional activator/tetratricopeptide (TPR) repeat protein
MEFRALGPIELWSDGQQRDLGPARLRSILAMLLLAPRTIVPAETLIDRLWDSRPPPRARESLSAYIARLRASLRAAAGDSVPLAGRAGGYVLDVEPESIDVHQFRRLRRQADAAAAGGDYDRAAALLREADGLWRGQALAGLSGGWVTRMRDGLQEERRGAIRERVECELELGRHADLVGELGQLVAQYPLDETFIAHQMTALYGSGRPGEALSLYRESRRQLISELGTEPGPVLSELHQRILGRDPQLAVRWAGQRPGRGPRPDTLPPETAEFVGRGAELGRLTEDHGRTPQVALIAGMPGVGKTALAVRAARLAAGQYPDGTLYLDLHSHDRGRPALEPAEALHRLLRMLAIPAAQIPESVGARVTLWRAQLSRRAAVVILDDAARPDQIRPLLPVTGRCLVLVTTRRRLSGFGRARTLTLDVLPVDDAVTLFRRIAGEDRARDVAAVTSAVELCGRLPLAIQLAAARVAQDHSLGLAGLIAALSPSPTRPGGPGAASPQVTAAFDLSYGALEPDHQRLLRRLGISPCVQFTSQAAAALDGCTLAEAEKALAALLDQHLLTPAPGAQFRIHDLIRGYAAARAAGEDSAAVQRQAVRRLIDYYLHTADRADRVLHPFRRRLAVRVAHLPAASPALGTPGDAAAWLESEWRNILQAAQHAGRHEWQRECADLTHVLAGFLAVGAYWDEAIAAHAVALQACRDLADPARIARAALEFSAVSQQTGQHEATLPLAEEAAAIYRTLIDPRGEAEALDLLGMAHQRATRSRAALAYFHEARIRYRTAADEHGVADTLSHSGIACWHLRRYPEATAHLREALAGYRRIGDRRGEAKTLNNLGMVYQYGGFHRDALDAYHNSRQIFGEIGGAQNEAILYHNIGSLYHYKGHYEAALAACRQALAIYRDIGDLPDEADVLNEIGAIYQSAACPDDALICHQRARRIAEAIGNLSQQVIAVRKIADLHRGTGQYDAALDHYRTALRLAAEAGDPYEEGKILEGIAESALSARRPDAARIVFRQALDIFERLGVPEALSARIRIETLDPVPGLCVS